MYHYVLTNPVSGSQKTIVNGKNPVSHCGYVGGAQVWRLFIDIAKKLGKLRTCSYQFFADMQLVDYSKRHIYSMHSGKAEL